MHEIKTVHPASTTALGGNIPYTGLEWQPNFRPEYTLYVFNISSRTFQDEAGKGIIGRIKMKAPGVTAEDPHEVMRNGKPNPGDPARRYRYVTSFPHPYPVVNPNDMTGEIETKFTDGRRFLVDMISPDNPTLSLDFVVDPAKAFSIGNDYAPRGIFFSYSNPPDEKELDKAYDRMEKYYAMLNEKAATLELTDKVALQNAIQQNPDHVYAANYYGKPFAWAQKAKRPVECPNCGEQKPAGRLFHQTSYGTFCVEPTQEAWKAVVMSGNRKYEEVPDELRWKRPAKAE
jgi:hypothetical protein